MRWVVVKFVNLIVVLIIVTFIVAAIFSGPMAERQKTVIYNNVNQQVKNLLERKTPYEVLQTCVQFVGKQRALKSLYNLTYNSLNTTLISKELQGATPAQKSKLADLLSKDLYNLAVVNRVGNDAQFKAALQKDVLADAKQAGLEINETVAKDIVNSIYTSITQHCRQSIVDYKAYLQLHRLGLDRPWYIISLHYTKQLLLFKPLYASVLTTQYWPYQGDRNALHIILERLPYSVLLFTTSSVLTLLFAIPLALYAARRPGGAVDSTITGWSVFSVSIPWWWLGMVFIYLFTYKYHIFPSPYKPGGINWRSPKQVLEMAALPVFTVTILSVGDTSYRIRNILLDVFNEDFVTVARAKGVPERIVLRKHVMRAAAPPLVTIVLFSIVLSVFSGAIITELVFNWFGLGRLYWDAISSNDVPVLVELTYITTLLYLVIRFILDILYTLLDPRIRRA